jgi:hypothetical protein
MINFERVGYKWWHLALLLGLFFLVLPGRILAAGVGQEPPPSDVQPTTDALHSGSQGPDAPHAPVNTTLLDFQLPGTQPGGLTTPLVAPANCTGCHVNHIADNFAGSMMANAARDPLFRAALQVANKDAKFGGDTCIRCHAPNAWLNNRSSIAGDPTTTDGRLINAADLQGIACSTCHRLVPPAAMPGEASGDAAERAALTGPFITGNSAYLVDRNDVRRGPFTIAAAPHAVAQSSYLQSAELCATCHDIDNPLLTLDTATNEFKLNALNSPASASDHLFPIERTYSEWKLSTFGSSGVTGLDYPGLKKSTGTTNGPITICQDCHMPVVSSPIATGGPTRTVGQHQWAGGSASWQDGIIKAWEGVAADTSLNKTQTTANKTLGLEMLKRAAQLDVALVNGQLEVKITNNTGHKLPTGYAEGRRMWIEIYQLKGPTPVFTSGLMAGVIGPLIKDPHLKSYEIKLGLTDAHAQTIERPEIAGEGFHFILNNKVFQDNRIPPRGFLNSAYVTRDMQPVGATYADGQYWDTTYYPIHPEADSISVRLMYQTATSEYLDFLASEANFTVADAVRGPTNWGQLLNDLRSQNIGKPVVMVAKQLFIPRAFVAPTGTDTGACTDSAQPCKTINYALGQAVDGTEIRVAAGTYKELIQVTKPVSLTGGFTLTNWVTPAWTVNKTILDGQNSYRPLTINADRVRVDGFIIRNGNTSGGDRLGGGLYIGGVNEVNQATLVNLRLENNVASNFESGEGGGLYAEMGNNLRISARLTLNNVTVFSNTASTGNLGATGGGMRLFAAGNSPLNVDMTNVTVQNNIAGNDFSSNGGGIALNLNGGQATLRQSRILGNRAARIKTFLGGPSRGGGIYVSNGTLNLLNTLLAGNEAELGAAIAVQSNGDTGATVAMNYVTLADNFRTSAEAGATIYTEGLYTYLLMTNALFSGNPVAFAARNNNNQVTEVLVASTLIDNNVGTVISGTATITGTPLRGVAGFVNAATGDYHLTAASSAVDKGNGLAPLIDLDGATRPKGVTTDIGAYEFAPTSLNNQTITFNPLPDKLVSDPPFAISATASSGLPVSFASLTATICTVSGNSVTLITTGTCTIQAGQAGNGNFNPAPPVAQSFAVKSSQKSDQTITFGKPADRALGDLPFALSATASSGLPVAFTGNTPGVCTVNGNSVTLLAVGVCSITATQEGNALINPATPVTQSFAVTAQSGGQRLYLPLVTRQ